MDDSAGDSLVQGIRVFMRARRAENVMYSSLSCVDWDKCEVIAPFKSSSFVCRSSAAATVYRAPDRQSCSEIELR